MLTFVRVVFFILYLSSDNTRSAHAPLCCSGDSKICSSPSLINFVNPKSIATYRQVNATQLLLHIHLVTIA